MRRTTKEWQRCYSKQNNMAARDVLKVSNLQSEYSLVPTCSGKENLPPYDEVVYRVDFDTLPNMKFDGLYRFMVGRN